MRTAFVMVMAVSAATQIGCATIFSGSSSKIRIESEPKGADVVVIGGGAASMILKAQKLAGLADSIIAKLSPHVPQDSVKELRKHSFEDIVGIVALSMTSPFSLGFLSEDTRKALASLPKPVKSAILDLIGIEDTGKTPMTVTLDKGAAYAVVVARGDQVPKVVGLKNSFDFLVVLNIFNLLLGVPIDILTGAWMDIGPEKVHVKFQK